MKKINKIRNLSLIMLIILFSGCFNPSESEIKKNFYSSYKNAEIISISKGEGDFDNVYIYIIYKFKNKKKINEIVYLYQRRSNKWIFKVIE